MTASAADLVKALDRHYTGGLGHADENSHACYQEVTAPDGRRRCDYLAVSLWSSRGLTIDAHEIKVSRSDWLRERSQPAKAEAFWSSCSRWWIVVPDESIVKEHELPEGWGLMVPPAAARARSMKVLVAPAVRRLESVPIGLLTRLLTRDREITRQWVHDARWDGKNEGLQQGRDEATRMRQSHGGLMSYNDREKVQFVERASKQFGRDLLSQDYLTRVGPEEFAAALQLVLTARKLPRNYTATNIRTGAERIVETAKALETAVEEWAKLGDPSGAAAIHRDE